MAKLTNKDKEIITTIAKVAPGIPQETIGKAFNISQRTISHVLVAQGLRRNKGKHKRNFQERLQRQEKVLAFVKKRPNATLQQIARAVNAGLETVRQDLIQAKLR